MGFSAEDLAEAGILLRDAATAVRAVQMLRERFPGVPVTRADASDLSLEAPFLQYEGFDLYLVDGGSHCWSLTDSPERASALVVAAHAGRK